MQDLQKICSHSGVSTGSKGIPKQMGHSNAHGPSCSRERLGGAAAEVVAVVVLVDVDVMVRKEKSKALVLQNCTKLWVEGGEPRIKECISS